MKIKKNHFASLRNTKTITRGKTKYTVRAFRDRFFFPDEWMAFYDCLKPKQKITFNMLINTGARINEIRNLKVIDIDFERNNIVLRVTKRVVKRIGIDKKGYRKIRTLPISSKFSKFLKKVIKDYELQAEDCFPILSTPASNIGMKKALQKIGVEDWDMFSVHNVRKTLENWLLALDVDAKKVFTHFGHSLAIALRHYVTADIFSFEDRRMMRDVIGDLYMK